MYHLISLISTMKVLWPEARLSDAPTRVNILSVMVMLAAEAGTKLPMWAMSTMSATCRMYVLLPAILGPVSIISLSSLAFIMVLLGTKPSFTFFSTTG